MSKPCPQCNTPMCILYVGAVQLDQCNECQGIWFDHCELHKIVSNPESLEAECSSLLWMPEIPHECTKKRFCPCCHNARMKRNERNGVTVDQCQRCAGIWLDGGELYRIYLEQRKLRTASEKIDSQDSDTRGLGVIEEKKPRPLLYDGTYKHLQPTDGPGRHYAFAAIGKYNGVFGS